jgi:hypothetical protein
MNDPLAVRCLSRDDADVMRPDHHHADSGTAGIHAFVRPGPRKRQTTVRFSEIFAEVTTAPSPVTVMPVVGTRIRFDGKDEQQNRSGRERLQHGLLHKR